MAQPPRRFWSLRTPRPPEKMFISLERQLDNIRRWNEEREWGFHTGELDAIDVAPREHEDPLVVDLVAVYLPSTRRIDGVRRTCDELWKIAAAQQPHAWSWDWEWDEWKEHPKPVRLLDGLVHEPGVRRVTIDLGAYWEPGRYVRPRHLRDQDSAHAELLAAAAHFPDWVRAMDGKSVPFVWLSGYQLGTPEPSDHRLPGLAWVRYRATMSLTANWADHAHSGWASPVRVA
ncbi:MAG TPA: hypothetical protein VGD72_12115 [Mycobacteriales bacterium]|jgi:hypothetical protein